MIRTLTIALSLAMAAPVVAQDVLRTDLSPAESAVPAPETVHGWVARYFDSTRSGTVEPWLANFAENAVVDDPVGTPVKADPTAIRAMGEGFLGAFETVGLHESFVHVSGLEAVARWEGRGTTPDGTEVTFQGINLFTFDSDGRITELRGFFAPPGS
ncbi:MAG: nuclear transport factor 2 family protein [Pseudomonadota bacterium]